MKQHAESIEIFNAFSPLDKQLRKKKRNCIDYFKSNKEKLLQKVNGKVFRSHEYDVTPIQDYYVLQNLLELKKLGHDYQDKNNFEEIVSLYLHNFIFSNTDFIIAKEVFINPVLSYSNRDIFSTFFLLKILKTDIHIIPLLLDYHFEQYKNDSARKNSLKNKKEFLSIVQFQIIENIKKWSPFNIEKLADVIVNWLTRKRLKLKLNYSETNSKAQKRVEKADESVDTIYAVLLKRQLINFKKLENKLVQQKLIKKVKNKFLWTKSINDFMLLILLMNKYKYFTNDITDKKNKEVKNKVRNTFENYFNVKLSTQFEHARLLRVDVNSNSNIASLFKYHTI